MKKVVKIGNVILISFCLLIPLFLFLNRFLIPDVSYDSLNYHLFLGQRGIETYNNKFEFFPTGIHNFSPIFDIPGYILTNLFGYRLGSISSLIFLYLSVFVIYKIFRLYQPKYKIIDQWWGALFLVNIFFSFEAFLQIATFYVDIQVAFWTLLGLYFLLKYEKSKITRDVILSSLSIGILFLGKITGAYFLLPYFVYLFFILWNDKKLSLKNKIGQILLSGFIILSISLSTFYKNFKLTGNPVFPYYNAIFMSEYYPTGGNFTQDKSGGDTIVDKIFWGIVSVGKPQKLGQVHDLFHDYKINIYFGLIFLVIAWSIYKKDKKLLKLSLLYLFSYEVWSWVFGYLRYAIFLEFFGALIIFIWLTKLKGMKKYVVIIPLFFILLLQNKRIVNLSLAYDISFRPGFFYNRLSYPKEWDNFNIKKINVDEALINKYQPKVYLNCASPNMSYLVLSDFENLPVVNIDNRAYKMMTDNQFYVDKSKELFSKYNSGESFNFVTIAAETGLNAFYKECKENLISRNYKIYEEVDSNFLGYEGQKLKIIFGRFSW